MRHKPSSSSSTIDVNQAEVDQPVVESEGVAEDGTGNADDFTALSNRRNMNKNGTKDDMA